MSSDGATEKPPSRTAAEWVTLTVSLLLLLGVVGTVIALWLSPNDDPPRFQIERGEVRNQSGRYQLVVTIRNDGDLTASEVTVEGVLAEEPSERTTTTFDFVPGRSAVEGVLIFSHDPSNASVRVVSYQKP